MAALVIEKVFKYNLQNASEREQDSFNRWLNTFARDSAIKSIEFNWLEIRQNLKKSHTSDGVQ